MKRLIIPGIILTLAGLLALTSCISSPYPYGPGGMMRPWGGGAYQPQGQRLSIDQAVTVVRDFLRARNDPDLKVEEILEFSNNFYVDFSEKSTGIHAFEALIDPYTGSISPEPGPNMMWNTKYGMMSGMMWGRVNSSTPMTVTGEQTDKYAQEFISGYLPGGKAGEAERFYGYYTIDILKDTQIYGMLSVNGYTGQVWHHSWHGQFIGMKKFD